MEEWNQRLYRQYVSTGQAKYFEGKGNFNNSYFDNLITKHLPRDTNISILDLACGNGRLIYALKKYNYRDIIGIDLSEEQVAVAHGQGITEVKCQDINAFLKESREKRYDVIFLMDILEHLEKQEIFKLLDDVNNVLVDNGVVIIHAPNGAGVFGMKVRYGDFTHQNAFTSQSMQQILHACNFDTVNSYEDKPTIHGLKSLIRYILWQILTAPLRVLLTVESGKAKHLLSQNMLVVAKKSSNKSNNHSVVKPDNKQMKD